MSKQDQQGKEKAMEVLKDTLEKALEKAAYLKAYESSCFLAWGEVEMPRCLQQENEVEK